MVRFFPFSRRSIVSFSRAEQSFPDGIIPQQFRWELNSTIHLPNGSVTLLQGLYGNDAWFYILPDAERFQADCRQFPGLKSFLQGFYIPYQHHSYQYGFQEVQGKLEELQRYAAKTNTLPNEHLALFHELYLLMHIIHGKSQREVNHNHCRLGLHKFYWSILDGEACVFDFSQGIFLRGIKLKDLARYHGLEVVNDIQKVEYVT